MGQEGSELMGGTADLHRGAEGVIVPPAPRAREAAREDRADPGGAGHELTLAQSLAPLSLRPAPPPFPSAECRMSVPKLNKGGFFQERWPLASCQSPGSLRGFSPPGMERPPASDSACPSRYF